MSFLLDTCVLSELVKPCPDGRVVNWIECHDEHLLYLSVLTIGELHKGIAKLPSGARQERLRGWVGRDLMARFDGRILDVTVDVAARWGAILGEAEQSGQPVPVIDALIAASALVAGCAVVTRNIGDLARTGVKVVNPWHQGITE